MLKFGVSNNNISLSLPLNALNRNVRFSEQSPLTTLNTNKITLNNILVSTLSQCSSRNASLADSRRLLPNTSLAAAFWTFCNLYKSSFEMFMSRLLQRTSRGSGEAEKPHSQTTHTPRHQTHQRCSTADTIPYIHGGTCQRRLTGYAQRWG